MNAQGLSAWFHGGDGLKLWEETYAPFNLIPRPGGSTGVQMGGWFNKKNRHDRRLQGFEDAHPRSGRQSGCQSGRHRGPAARR
jgi:TRAP-type mannitol/chloroaromatic compound transport system substrate-binding protein